MKTTVFIVALLAVGGALALSFGPFPSSAVDDPVFYNELGFALGQEGRLVEAQDAFATAVSLDPSYANARKNLYVAAFTNEDYATAVEHSAWVVAHDGRAQHHFDHAQALVMWARTDATDGSDALAALESALEHLDTAGSYPHAAENAVIVRNVMASI